MSSVSFTLRNLTTPLILAGMTFAGCSHTLAPVGHYQDAAVIADGNAGDWNLPLRFSNASYTLQHNVTNDSKNLYVCVISSDEATQMRILRAGLSVYIDSKGDQKKDIALHFPVRKQPEPDSRYRSRNGDPITNGDNRTRKDELLIQSNYYSTTGFSDIENGQFGLDNKQSPIKVALKLNNNDSLLVYEAVIPLKNVPGADLATRSAKKSFSVGVVLESVPAQGGGGGGYNLGGGGMRGMGMGRMGGM